MSPEMSEQSVFDALGWNAALASAFEEVRSKGERALEPGRIIRQESLVRVQLADRAVLAKPSGKLLHGASSSEAIPVIGDWVAVAPPTGGGVALMHAVLPWKSALVRRNIENERDVQVIAANVDLVFLVNGLDAPINLRRIERMLAITLASGAQPVLVLSKADLAKDLPGALAEVARIATGAVTIPLSAREGQGLEQIRALLAPGITGVMIGLSGVGKSTLMNRLVGEERLATFDVREEDRKGRHTTTHRQLFVLENGGMLIDSPGMREFGLVDDEAGVADAFADVEAVASQCRFADCTHSHEPGCAVVAASESGELDPGRLDAWKKLQAERAYLQKQKNDPAARRERKAGVSWERVRSKKKRS